MEWLTRRAALTACLAGASMLAAPVHATTGDGCWAVTGVPSGDVLNVRAERSARSRIVHRLSPDAPAIVSGGWDVLDAEARCLPRSRPLDARWCPVSIYTGDGSHRGFAKRRYLRPVECP